MGIDLTRQEIHALATSVKATWEGGNVRDQGFAVALLGAEQKLGAAWEAMGGDKPTEALSEPQDAPDADKATEAA